MTKLAKQDLLEALRDGLTDAQIAEKFGASPITVGVRRRQLVRQGFSPEHDWNHQVPDGYTVKGVSTLYDKEGNVAAQWVKSDVDRERQLELVRQAIREMTAAVEPLPAVLPPTHDTDDQLANLYVLTDFHLGMLSWGEESGDDYDLRIAEELAKRWFAAALNSAPNARVGILGQLGDFLHWDGLDAVTPSSHHVLDADTRFQKLTRVAIRLIRAIIEAMLQKHLYVHVICAEGNHDMASSIWLRELLTVLYENEPRISVDRNPDPYYCYSHGKTVLFFHHGHKVRPGQVDSVFVAKYKQQYGASAHAYAHLGHLHHAYLKESSLMVVEQHRTLAAKDAYASRGGWLSGRSAPVITYHKEFGEVARLTINPEMVK